MANKIFNTIVKLRTDSIENWTLNGASIIPEKGEACIVHIPAGYVQDGVVVTTTPLDLMKIGDGVTSFNNLNYVGAQSMDIYNWAKQQYLTIDDTLSTTIASGDRLIIQDTSDSKKVKKALAFTANSTKYLREDGTWQTITTTDTKVANLTANTGKVVTSASTSGSTTTLGTTNVKDLTLTGYSPVAGGYVGAGDSIQTALSALDTAVKNAVAGGGEINQNAYSTISDGTNNAAANTKTDTITFVDDNVVDAVVSNVSNNAKVTLSLKNNSVTNSHISGSAAIAQTKIAGSLSGSTNLSQDIANLNSALSGLSSALKYKGTTTATMTDGQTGHPTGISNVTVGDVVIDAANAEFVWDGSKWNAFGTPSAFQLKFNDGTQSGSGVVKSVTQSGGTVNATASQIVNSDIASNAAISQSKISGLATALGNKQDKIPDGNNALVWFARADSLELFESITQVNGSIQNSGDSIVLPKLVMTASTDDLVQGTDTIVLFGGTANATNQWQPVS